MRFCPEFLCFTFHKLVPLLKPRIIEAKRTEQVKVRGEVESTASPTEVACLQVAVVKVVFEQRNKNLFGLHPTAKRTFQDLQNVLDRDALD